MWYCAQHGDAKDNPVPGGAVRVNTKRGNGSAEGGGGVNMPAYMEGYKWHTRCTMAALADDPEVLCARTKDALQHMLCRTRRLADGPLTVPTGFESSANLRWVGVKNGTHLLVFVSVGNKSTVDMVSAFLQTPEAASVTTCIIVYEIKITPRGSADLLALGVEMDRSIEIFSMAEMVDDPLQSGMTPSYRELSATEVAALVAHYGALDRFPQLRTDDPVCRRFAARAGTVFEIIRSLGIEDVHYRVVCDV